jgi:hypothetical protein
MTNNPLFRIFFWGGGMKVQIFPTCVIPARAESEEDAEDCIRADVIEGIRVTRVTGKVVGHQHVQ